MNPQSAQADSRRTAMEVVHGRDLTGMTCVITGASSGLGRQAARALAGAGAHVVLTARNPDALRQTRDWIQAVAPAATTSPVGLDLASLASIRSAAAAIAGLAPAVDVLMNNAGVMFTPFGRTADGFEMQVGINHLGHFALTDLLADRLAAAGGARVINLSSQGHHLGDIDLGDPNWERRDYDKFRAYGAAKTANVLHAVELNRRLGDGGVRACAVHPGMVATNLMRHMTGQDVAAVTAGADRTTFEVLTAEQGAATQVWAAVCPELPDAVYLADCGPGTAVAPYAVDPARAAQLWQLSRALCLP